MTFRYADEEDAPEILRVLRAAYAVEVGNAGEAFRASAAIVSDADVLRDIDRWLLGERRAEHRAKGVHRVGTEGARDGTLLALVVVGVAAKDAIVHREALARDLYRDGPVRFTMHLYSRREPLTNLGHLGRVAEARCLVRTTVRRFVEGSTLADETVTEAGKTLPGF